MSAPTHRPQGAAETTPYLGYGSNLWRRQMAMRCPAAAYAGVARLRGFRWIINGRGYANVVAVGGSSPSITTAAAAAAAAAAAGAERGSGEAGADERKGGGGDDDGDDDDWGVYGLVYDLTADDEARLDVNEGVPECYGKETLECEFWAGRAGRVDVAAPPTDPRRPLLVYVDRRRTDEAGPKAEYVHRMNAGVADALAAGVPAGYVEGVIRRFVPEEGRGEERAGGGEEARRLAERQAARFEDE